MAAPVTRGALSAGGRCPKPTGASGFSMIEMLMAAFILAIGLLGLALLQTYTFRSQAGSGSLQMATLVAKQALEQIEMLGRNSLLCSQSGVTPPVNNPSYFSGATHTSYFNYQGHPVAQAQGFFTVTQNAVIATGGANGVIAPIPGLGGIAAVTVTVTWSETVTAAQTPIVRKVTLNRRINYATS